MYRKGRMEEEDYDEEYSVLEKQLKVLQAEKPMERNLEGIKELLESDFRTIYNALNPEHKKAFWRKTIKEFKLTEGKKIDADSIIFF